MSQAQDTLAYSSTDSIKKSIDAINDQAYSLYYTNVEVAKDDVKVAFELSQKINYDRGLANAYNVTGTIAWSQSDYSISLKNYFKALELFKKLQDKTGILVTYNNIAELYKKIDEEDKGLQYLFMAQELNIEEFGQKRALISVNIGEVFVAKADYDSATFYFMEGLNNSSITEREKAYAYNGLANVANETREYESAIYFNKRALAIRKEINEIRSISNSYNKLANIHTHLEHFDLAEQYYDSALSYSHISGARDLRMEIYDNRSKLFKGKNDFEKALDDYTAYALLKDSIFSEQKSRQIADIQNSHQTELLKQENENALLEVKQRNAIITVIVILLLAVIVIAYIMHKQRLAQKNVINLLNEKNDQIQLQSEELHAQSEKMKYLNQNLENLNGTLEERIKERTSLLKEQNKVLAEYAFINAHELRAPVATVLGLVNLLRSCELREDEEKIVNYLHDATTHLDEVIKDIKEKLERRDYDLFDHDL